MNSLRDRDFARINRRLDMMLARGVLRGVDDGGVIQQMQVGLLQDETLDGIERFQTYGLSAVPPAGSEVLAAFIGGNRDQGVVIAVNDRGSRPRGGASGEVVLFNDRQCEIRLTPDGDVIVKGARNVRIETAELVTVSSGERVIIEAVLQIELNAPLVTVNGTPIP